MSCRFYKELDTILSSDPTSTAKTTVDTLVAHVPVLLDRARRRKSWTRMCRRTQRQRMTQRPQMHAARISFLPWRSLVSHSSRILAKRKQERRPRLYPRHSTPPRSQSSTVDFHYPLHSTPIPLQFGPAEVQYPLHYTPKEKYFLGVLTFVPCNPGTGCEQSNCSNDASCMSKTFGDQDEVKRSDPVPPVWSMLELFFDSGTAWLPVLMSSPGRTGNEIQKFPGLFLYTWPVHPSSECCPAVTMVHCGIAPGGQYFRIASTLTLIRNGDVDFSTNSLVGEEYRNRF
ncbi:hypothetical protein UY3_02713 [Chelonia mydas]|uniref:Uncharacterized protein n=1 Tax=Chelonia mydas TaxID=8469 RepID=M7BW26_CHEMY|nr:hypothetical protein UY3_02713 [Chelonia mydas]